MPLWTRLERAAVLSSRYNAARCLQPVHPAQRKALRTYPTTTLSPLAIVYHRPSATSVPYTAFALPARAVTAAVGSELLLAGFVAPVADHNRHASLPPLRSGVHLLQPGGCRGPEWAEVAIAGRPCRDK